MAFSVAYYDLLNKNIRHIYSSLPANVRFRTDPVPGVTLNSNDGRVTSHQNLFIRRQPDKTSQKLYRRLWAYSPEYSSPMPRAPAFRCVSTAEAQAIVDRVSQTTRTHNRRRQSYRAEEEDRDSSLRSATPRSGRRCRSAMEMEALMERVRRPTTVSRIRSDLREGHGLDPVEVVTQRSSSKEDL